MTDQEALARARNDALEEAAQYFVGYFPGDNWVSRAIRDLKAAERIAKPAEKEGT